MADQELTAEISGEAIKKLENETHSYIRRFGWAVLIFSLIDAGLHNFSDVLHIEYAQLFGIPGVIVGVILLYPNMRSASAMRCVVAFSVPIVILGIIVDPVLTPFALFQLKWQLETLSLLGQYIPQLSVLVVSLLLYVGLARGIRKLSQGQAAEQVETMGQAYRVIWWWLGGMLVSAGLLFGQYATNTGKVAKQAIAIAQQEFNDDAQYWVQKVVPESRYSARVLIIRYTDKRYEPLIVSVAKE